MTRLYTTIAIAIAMLPAILLAPGMATSPAAPLYTHFTYMFAHANIIHWLINAWTLLILHNLFRQSRILISYILSILVSFIPTVSLSLTSHVPYVAMSSQPLPLLGTSVITCFFMGFLFPHLYHRDRLLAMMMPALIIIGFIIPGIAAIHHLIMFLLGLVHYHLESLILTLRHYTQ